MSNTERKAPIVVLGVDTDDALDMARRTAARRAQIALGAIMLHNQTLHEAAIAVPEELTTEEIIGKMVAKRLAARVTGNK